MQRMEGKSSTLSKALISTGQRAHENELIQLMPHTTVSLLPPVTQISSRLIVPAHSQKDLHHVLPRLTLRVWMIALMKNHVLLDRVAADTALQTPQQTRDAPPQPDHNASGPSSSSKPSKISLFRQWMKENPNAEPPPNGFPPDGPPLRSGQAKTDANGNPSMYERISFSSMSKSRQSSFENNLPTVAENGSSRPSFPTRSSSMKPLSFFTESRPTTPPSGVALDPKDLNAFETLQRNVCRWSSQQQESKHGSNPSVLSPGRALCLKVQQSGPTNQL